MPRRNRDRFEHKHLCTNGKLSGPAIDNGDGTHYHEGLDSQNNKVQHDHIEDATSLKTGKVINVD